jgi:hypothetical protein
MESKMSQQKLPETDSISELAQFWDTHDVTDFEHELEEVTEPVFQHETNVTIRFGLRPEEVKAIKKLARSLGTSHIELIREWVRERIPAS